MKFFQDTVNNGKNRASFSITMTLAAFAFKMDRVNEPGPTCHSTIMIPGPTSMTRESSNVGAMDRIILSIVHRNH
jgi:hypothetical protein